jgi:chromosome segregation ATPase
VLDTKFKSVVQKAATEAAQALAAAKAEGTRLVAAAEEKAGGLEASLGSAQQQLTMLEARGKELEAKVQSLTTEGAELRETKLSLEGLLSTAKQHVAALEAKNNEGGSAMEAQQKQAWEKIASLQAERDGLLSKG